MDSARWRKIKELFNQAVRLDPDEQMDFIDEACGEDRELREKLIALLETDEETDKGEFMKPLPVTDIMDLPKQPDAAGNESLVGVQVGQYRIKGLISSGGMGTVYEAEQETPKRTVALKIMNRGLSSSSTLKRFEYESQILARLQHPGIAQVFEAGRHEMGGEGGMMLPYFAMEYIEDAKPITAYAREKALPIKKRVELFLQVCRAVQHGNQRGIIHRDLKPGNILVNGSGEVKVIDFGVARVTESDQMITTLHTEEGQLIGTLQYMSPEQCAGKPHDLDVRSDVYSLGLVFYEMLLDRLPYDVRKTSVIEAARRIREVLPPKPSTIVRSLRGDLDTIMLTALEKERGRRYQSVGAMAEDLRRYLSEELILARPAGLSTRIIKSVKRRPVVTVGVTVGLVSILAFVMYVAFYSYPNLVKEQFRTASALSEASARAREKAEINRFLEDMLSAPNPFKEGRDVKVAEVLDRAAQKIDGAFPDQPSVEASLRNTIGWSYKKLGLFAEAEHHLRTAVDLYRSNKDPDEVEILQTENRLAAVLKDRDKLEEAEALGRKSHEGLQALLGEKHIDTIRTMVNLAKIQHVRDRLDEAEALLEKALASYQSIFDEDNIYTLETMSQLAITKKAKGDLTGAEALFSETYAKQCDLLGKEHSNTVNTLGSLAMLKNELGDYKAAEALLREAVEIRGKVQGEDHPATLAMLNNLSVTVFNQEKREEAEVIQRELLRLQRNSLGEAHRDTLATMMNVAVTTMNLKRFDEAEILYKEVLSILESQEGGSVHVYLSACVNLGILLREQGKFAESEALLRRTIEEYEPKYGKKNRFMIYARHSLARVYQKQNRHAESEAMDRAVLEIRQEAMGENHPSTIESMDYLTLSLAALGKFEEAEPMLSRVYEAYRSEMGDEHLWTLMLMDRWGWVLLKLNRMSKAKSLLEDAVEIAGRTLKDEVKEERLLKGQIQTHYGHCLLEARAFEEAEARLLEGYGILKAVDPEDPMMETAIDGLIRLYDLWGKTSRKQEWFEKRKPSSPDDGT